MNQQEKSKKEKAEKKGLLQMVRELWRKAASEGDGGGVVSPDAIPAAPSPETVERLIGKVTGENADKAGKADGDEPGKTDGDEPGKPKESCPYATKRAIVESLAEIKRFAVEHELASTVVRALLTLLAEMVAEALKGKVGGRALDLLLKAIRYDSARKEAYAEGRKAGRNDKIKVELFPGQDTDMPDISGSFDTPRPRSSIFDIAKEAN